MPIKPDPIDTVLGRIDQSLTRLAGGDEPPRDLKTARSGSRFAGQHADPGLVARIAAGGTADGLPADVRTVAADGAFGGGHRAARGAWAKALAESTGTAGGYLVPVEISSQIAEMTRARTVVMQLGPTTIDVAKETDVPAITTGATAYYIAENAAIPTSQETFAIGLQLRPKPLTALIPISNRLLRDLATDPSIEEVVKRDVAEVIALRQDLAFLSGVGTSEPLGILNTPGLTPGPSLGPNGRTPTFDDFGAMIGALRAANAPFSKPGFIINSRTLGTLQNLKDSLGRYLWQGGLLTFDNPGVSGTLLGVPYRVSNQLSNTLTQGTSSDTSVAILGSDWGDAFVGRNLDFTMEMSSEASYTTDGGTTWTNSFQNDQSLLRVIGRHDFGLRRPALWTTLTGIRP